MSRNKLSLLFLIICLVITGCGDKNEASVEDGGTVITNTDAASQMEAAQKSSADEETEEDTPSDADDAEEPPQDRGQGPEKETIPPGSYGWADSFDYVVDSDHPEELVDFTTGDIVDFEQFNKDCFPDLSHTFFSCGKTPEPERSASEYPEVFDLREKGVVTPVKSQDPWGSCWSFGAVAASEISILSSMEKSYDETGLDLSERHLVWFAQSHLDETAQQKNEGIHWLDSDSQRFNEGGGGIAEFHLFAMGVGPALEQDYPYCDENGGRDESGEWSLANDARNSCVFQLKNGNLLPDITLADSDRNFIGYDENAILCIKDELMAGRGVQVAYELGGYSPTYGHYSENVRASDHEVCIVGWDDTFPKEQFARDDEPAIPEKDGAWIVKNSWGAETPGSDPVLHRFGYENEKGEATGYFYLSYYDRSAKTFKSYDFDTEDTYKIQQYDYMQNDSAVGKVSKEQISMANVFTAEEDGVLVASSLMIPSPMTSVRYSVYLLDESSSNPTDGELVSQTEDYYRFCGFHRTTLQDAVLLNAGQRYSIVVEAYTNGSETDGFLLCSTYAWAHDKENENERYYHSAVVNPGESLFYTAKYRKWIDYRNYLDLANETLYAYDNFPIKAYIVP